MTNSAMDKITDGTKLFVRFLRERGIKYIYAKETLRNAYRKKYERKQFSNFLNDDVYGNLLKYFDKFFSHGVYNVICHSFPWIDTENGHKFWLRMEEVWERDYIHK